ncbi:MAG: substrate-binding domain-containing protein [Planctomycetaceae bacterium]
MFRQKRIRQSLFIVTALIAATFAGCGEDSGPEKSAGEEVRGTIGYSALTLTNPFFKVIADKMTEEAAAHGYKVIVVSADQDVNEQSRQIDNFIVQGVTAIVLNPADSQSIGQAIRKANDAGIPVFTNDIKYAGSDGKVICHVATDNLQGGRLAGEAMVRLLGESGGQVGILGYPDVESCQMRVQGFKEVVDAHNAANPNAKIELVSELNGEGTRDAGKQATQAMIEANPDLAAIFAINDPSALGAWVAIDAVGKTDQVTIIGFDGHIDGKRAILEGKILCDPIQFPDRMAVQTIDSIVKYFAGDTNLESEILIPSQLYYKADAEKDPELASGH